jgi:hypothetical protein
VQLVLDEQFGARLAVGVEGRVVGLDVLQPPVGLDIGLDQPVQLLRLFALVPAGDAGASEM